MNELDMQKLVVDALIDGGHQAMKMNNEYIKGPSDLLIKMRGRPAFFLEAKRTDLGKTTIDRNVHTWKWDVTELQKKFMRDWQAAGMRCGILSFVQLTGGNINSLRMAVYPYKTCELEGWTASLADHIPLGKADVRFTNICYALFEI